MTGADIIGALLLADANIIAFCQAASIKGGRLPDNPALPAILVRLVSTVERQKLKWSGKVRTIDRVAVSVVAETYNDQRQGIALVRACCAGQIGTIGGAERVSVRPAGAGPDLDGPGNTFERTQDFRVSYDA